MRILITGGEGNLATKVLAHLIHLFDVEVSAPPSNVLDVTDDVSIGQMFKLIRPDVVLHTAAMTRPMRDHEKRRGDSIIANAIGSAKIANACISTNAKMVYISTDWVYGDLINTNRSGDKTPWKETDGLNPWRVYGLTKAAGENAARCVKKHLVLRTSFCSTPWSHTIAFDDSWKSWMTDTEAAEIISWLITDPDDSNLLQGVYNMGGKRMSAYQFVKRRWPDLIKSNKVIPGISTSIIPRDTSMSSAMLKQVLSMIPVSDKLEGYLE